MRISRSIKALAAFAVASLLGASQTQAAFIGTSGADVDSGPEVTLAGHSGEAGGREIIYIVNGAGMTSQTIHNNGDILGQPHGFMGLFRGNTGAHPNTLPGSHWAKFEFDQTYQLANLHIWNWNETPYLGFGWKHLGVEYSTNGTTWTTVTADTIVPMATGSVSESASLVFPLGGIMAKYVVLTNTGAINSAEENWSNGAFTNDAGLSEVRFEIGIPEPASLSMLSLGALALLRRRV